MSDTAAHGAASEAPISAQVARQAVHWLLELDSSAGESTAQLRQQWQAWLDADPEHARAWRHIAQVDGQLRAVPSALALQTLAAPGMGRRHAVQLAMLVTVGAGTVLAARQTGLGGQAWDQLASDLSTATGEQRETVLSDGTRLLLNTASAVDVRYSDSERLIVLRSGELLVHSAPDTAHRPLRVRTAQGTVRALGTRFTVRQQDGFTSVAVLQGAVQLQPAQAPHATQRLSAGEQGRFTEDGPGLAEPLQEGAGAWSEGMLVADNMRLDHFIAELARHRPGMLRCAPGAAALRVSGAYPLADTDRVLVALTHTLPVQLRSRTRWWVSVEPSPTPL